ncbi:acyltransferase family protein [Babesia bovis T2Bo]|uniref:Acyltransferase family protein n=1 Tax=Babesia bovis TaxID=5865 RepID=A7AUN4_BABBO|nr:acyltransferase family protein [Babesia bovis T2Bo]EDO06645.1 acyltransferase family protein [Babesia bovis T2Bo]BAN64262.1 acyltransferase family protein [Babesia bovis]|eukprot:XP_001610213.1 acyltransferase family protein [Babesia bovis T2Bo]
MRALTAVIRVLRSVQFYLLTVPIYLITSFLIHLYGLLLLPLYIWDKQTASKFCNQMFFHSFALSAFTLNYAWNYIIINDLPKDHKKKPRILMFNHLSSADPFLVSLIGRKTPLLCTYKDALHKLPTAKTTLWLSNHQPIKFIYDKVNDKKIPFKDSVKKVMKDCKIGVDNGFSIAVYPEGKRSRDGVLQEFKDGFFRFAVEHDIEILPCTISNSNSLWPLEDTYLIGQGCAYINVGKPISPTGKTVEELKHITRKAIYEGLKQCPSFNPEKETVPELE